MFCPHCNTQQRAFHKYCFICGESLTIIPSTKEKIPVGYKEVEGQYGTTYIIEIGSAADRPPGM